MVMMITMLRSLWPSVNRGRAGYWHGDDEAPRAEGRSDQVRRRYCDRISGERARERERLADWRGRHNAAVASPVDNSSVNNDRVRVYTTRTLQTSDERRRRQRHHVRRSSFSRQHRRVSRPTSASPVRRGGRRTPHPPANRHTVYQRQK